jgi:predicted ArsR family transcriptional regulator
MNTADQILFMLKMRGPQTAQAVAEHLQLTSMGARRQLEAAQEKGLVNFSDQAGKVGRPVRRWMLTERGHARFPDRHADVTVELIRQMRTLFGEDALDKLIAAREQAGEAMYRSHVEASAPIAERVAALAALREAEGYMAEAQVEPDGSVLLVENHCPICAAAQACQQFCRSELAVFRRVLGADCSVERAEHQLTGARRCVYRITAL